MRSTYEFTPQQVHPEREVVLDLQGIPQGATVSAATADLFESAIAEFVTLARPVSIALEVARHEFAKIYDGEGQNQACTPVAEIAPRADALALFVATVGDATCRRIQERFAAGDFALGYMLDSVASVAAENTAELTQQCFEETWKNSHEAGTAGVLRYSPGYCGWHITGQRRLFEALNPQSIGVSLNDSCLMQPLKSVSGVIIAGHREIHDFDASYSFCSQCETQGCRARVRRLFAE